MKIIENKEAFDRMWDTLMGESAVNEPAHTNDISYVSLRSPTQGIVLAYVIENRHEGKTVRLASDDIIEQFSLQS